MAADGRRKSFASGLYREAVSFNERFLYSASCLTTAFQITLSDEFLYSMGGHARVSTTEQKLGQDHDDPKPAFDASVDHTEAGCHTHRFAR
jgi:hypothetical protein